MGDVVAFKTIGLKELEDAMTKLPQELVGKNGGPIRTALMNGTLPMMRAMQSGAPFDEGELQKNIGRKRVRNPRGMSEAIEVGVKGKRGPTVDPESGRRFLNPWWLEKGTSKMAPRPFVMPAFYGFTDEFHKRFRRSLGNAVERIGKQIGDENAARVGAKVKRL